MIALKKPFFTIIAKKNVSAIVIREHEVFTQGQKLCPPASEMILDLANMSSKLTFLQWEHTVKLEDIHPAEKNTEYPVCLAGKRRIAVVAEDIMTFLKRLTILKTLSMKASSSGWVWL